MARHPHVNAVSSGKEYAKFFAIIGVIAAAATLMSTTVSFDWSGWMRWFMGGFFLVFGGFKLIGYEMFVGMFPRYDILARRFKLYAYAYPMLEVLLGVFYILDIGSMGRDVVTVFIMSIGAVGVLQGLFKRGPTFHCVCLGNIIKLPLSTVTLFENVVMAVMGILMIITTVAKV